MKRSILRMKFKSPVHIGNRNLSDSSYELKADTIFSALCIASNDIENLVHKAKIGKLRLSDAFPFIDQYLYVPKPLIYVEQHENLDYKLLKKIRYIEIDGMKEYLKGIFYPREDKEDFKLGDDDTRTQVSIGDAPFQVGIYSFKKNAGLYIIIEHDDDYIFEVFERLQYSGIGGKRSSGFGRFSFEVEENFDLGSGPKKILLNSAMAKEEELEEALIDANYLLQKRSGFINQSRYKKKDFYTFKAGSVFVNEFAGDVFDVGNDEHPVYNYAIPMFLGVS